MDSSQLATGVDQLSLSSLGINECLQDFLGSKGIRKPSPHQYAAIRYILNGEDVILQSKSGTGKTISFCIAVSQRLADGDARNCDDGSTSTPTWDEETKITHAKVDGISVHNLEENSAGLTTCPSLEDDSYEKAQVTECDEALTEAGGVIELQSIPFGDAVILTPTRELAKQIYDILVGFASALPSITVALSVGGSNLVGDIATLLTVAPMVLVVTPGRLKTIFKQIKRKSNSRSDGSSLQWNTRMLVLDEADMLLDDHFMDQTASICSKLVNPFVQVIAVSATFLKSQFKLYEDMLASVDQSFCELCESHLKATAKDTTATFRKLFSLHTYRCISDMIHADDDSETSRTKHFHEPLTAIERDDATGETSHDASYEDDIGTDSIQYNKVAGQASFSVREALSPLLDYLSNHTRDIRRLIISASHVSRVSIGEKGVICFTECELLQDVQEMKQAVTKGQQDLLATCDTPVLRNVFFCYTIVPEAPSIVKQISVKLKVVIALLKRYENHRCVIFCNQSHTRLLTASTLRLLGLECELISSRLSDESRRRNIDHANHRQSILIAADVMSRGVHIDNIELIINMDLPGSKEAFLHRSGRTGRYGRQGICVAICTATEMETLRYLEYALNFSFEFIKGVENMDAYSLTDSRCDDHIAAVLQSQCDLKTSDTVSEEYCALRDQVKSQLKQGCENTDITRPLNVEPLKENTTVNPSWNLSSLVRESLISAVVSEIFPARDYYCLRALGIIIGNVFHIPDLDYDDLDSLDYRKNLMQIRILKRNDTKIRFHLSKSTKDLLDSNGDAIEGSEQLLHLIVEQEQESTIQWYCDRYDMFLTAGNVAVITLLLDKGTCLALKTILAMETVEATIHDDMESAKLHIGYSHFTQEMAALPTACFLFVSKDAVLRRVHALVDNAHDITVESSQMVAFFIEQSILQLPKALVTVYEFLTRVLLQKRGYISCLTTGANDSPE